MSKTNAVGRAKRWASVSGTFTDDKPAKAELKNLRKSERRFERIKKAAHNALAYKSSVKETLQRIDMEKVSSFLKRMAAMPVPHSTHDVLERYALLPDKNLAPVTVSKWNRKEALEDVGYYYKDTTGDWNLQQYYYGGY